MIKNSMLRIIAAVVVGEILLALLTTVAQEVLVDGVYIEHSSISDLILGGTATLLAGAISGYVAGYISSKSKIPLIIISLLITIETIYLITANKTENPIWFDIISALALIFSVCFGYKLSQNKRD